MKELNYVCVGCKEQKYQQRIDKAIDYINCGLKGDINDDRAYIDENALLDILKGEDNESN